MRFSIVALALSLCLGVHVHGAPFLGGGALTGGSINGNSRYPGQFDLDGEHDGPFGENEFEPDENENEIVNYILSIY
ncbi:hypothetical protein K492DRAFT_190781 [Lichtheimia hyalospora FSU 10163]|nr:hypothetical protein K492DRAFT_190781 [Lichtheimia hyalospora FSU 10163]